MTADDTATGHIWELEHFDDRLPGLGPLTPHETRVLAAWKEQVRRDPLTIRAKTYAFGPHAGLTADREDREGPFPRGNRAEIAGRFTCDYLIYHETRTVKCIGLKRV